MIENRIHLTFTDRVLQVSGDQEKTVSLSESVKQLLFRSDEVENIESRANITAGRKSLSFTFKDKTLGLRGLQQTKIGRILMTQDELFISETYTIQ